LDLPAEDSGEDGNICYVVVAGQTEFVIVVVVLVNHIFEIAALLQLDAGLSGIGCYAPSEILLCLDAGADYVDFAKIRVVV